MSPVLPSPAPFKGQSKISLSFLLLMRDLGESFLLPLMFLVKFLSRWV